jgi:CheY-like chemotaxis protein
MNAQRKILIVDDDPVVGTSFRRVLSGKGYLVVSAENGYEALARLKDEQFDMVYTDLRMPGMDGFQVAEGVKATQPWTPVVIVTGYGSPDNEARARAAGVSDFLRKPLSPDMIEESAAKAMRTISFAPPAEVAEAATPAPAAPAPSVEAPVRRGGTLKNMLLFLSAPFVGLLYILLLPLVGMGMLAGFAGRALMQKPRARAVLLTTKRVLQIAAAPFIGLAYVIVLPIAGLGMLAWMALKAATRRAPAA